MFSRWAMSSASLWSFDGTLVLTGNRIRLLISDWPLIGLGCITAIDLSTMLPFFEVSAAATGMVLPFLVRWSNAVPASVLAPDATMVAIQGHATRCEYVGVGGGTGAEWST